MTNLSFRIPIISMTKRVLFSPLTNTLTNTVDI